MPSVHVGISSSHFYVNLYISFIYKDIFTKFTRNVHGYEYMYVHTFGLILKNKMATIADCLRITVML